MATRRAHIVLPARLVADIDAAVGLRGRSAFLTEVAEAELKKRRLLARLEEMGAEAVWKERDHPELKDTAAGWVRGMRQESEKALERRTGNGKD